MAKLIKTIAKAVAIIALMFATAICAFLWLAPVIGGTPDKNSKSLIQQSENYDGERFFNLTPTSVSTPSDKQPMGLWGMISPPTGKIPTKPIPSKPFSERTFKEGNIVWFGHSTIMVKTGGITILTDPVFFNASPIPYTIKPFPTQNKLSIDDLPDINVVVISHDHYDHLDYQAIREIDSKVDRYLVPLGVKAHLQRWDVADEKIT